MASLRLTLFFLAAIVVHCAAQKAAPGPAPAGPLNLTAILEKQGQYTTFIRLLTSTQVGQQVNNQVNNSQDGMTVFAPTDNAFQNLKAGTINSLSTQDQVKLVLFHVLPKCYTFDTFQTASNPVRTQATTDDGETMGLKITYLGVNSVNVSSGLVTTQINNDMETKCPLTVYQVDKVLLPEALFGAKAPKSAPASSKSKGDEEAEGPGGPTASADDEKNGAYCVKSLGLGFVATVGLITLGFLF